MSEAALANKYWEYYDDQTSDEFTELSYTNLQNQIVVIPTEQNLKRQVREIRRTCGNDVEIKVYKG